MKLLGLLVLVLGSTISANGAVSEVSWREISKINREGPYVGIVVPNAFELNPLLRSPSFVPHNKFPYFDFAGNLYNHVLFNYIVIRFYPNIYPFFYLFFFYINKC